MAFLKNITRFLSPKPAPALYLAAFGKHPGWNDHTDDMGLDTEDLVAVKRLLYIQGISQNIDAGAWESLDPASSAGIIDGRLNLFRHDFLWRTLPEVVFAGRLWSSEDGKGRAKYPMVVCAQLSDIPVDFAAGAVLPFLAEMNDRTAAARTAEQVREIVDTGRQQLQSRAIGSGGGAPSNLSAQDLAAVANHPDMGTDRAGFHRIVYQFASGMRDFRSPAKSSKDARRPEQVRLPTCGKSPADALLFWFRFAGIFVDESAPLLLFAPDQGMRAPWVDLIAGEPAPQNFFCIKAGTKAAPLTSDIPYTLDASFTRAVDNYVAACASLPEGSPLPAPPV